MRIEILLQPALAERVAFVSTVQGWSVALASSPEVASVRQGLRSGIIDAHHVRRWVKGILLSFTPGEHFAHEPALAALALALSDHPDSVADEFLRGLASIDAAEMPMATRMARLSLRKRIAVSRNAARQFALHEPDDSDGAGTLDARGSDHLQSFTTLASSKAAA